MREGPPNCPHMNVKGSSESTAHIRKRVGEKTCSAPHSERRKPNMEYSLMHFFPYSHLRQETAYKGKMCYLVARMEETEKGLSAPRSRFSSPSLTTKVHFPSLQNQDKEHLFQRVVPKTFWHHTGRTWTMDPKV